MNKGEITGSIFSKASKAFDTLGHTQIINNLSSCGVEGIEKEFFTDYLFNRKQTVCIGKETSDTQPVTCGVPQGSILGPLLFLVAFNGIRNTLRHCKIITYADDTVIYTSGKRKEDVEKALQEDFTSLADWLELNDLIINLKKGKTECTLFGTCQRVKNQSLDVKYRHHSILFTDTYKYLGVQLDQTLSLRSHLESTYKKAAGRLYLLKRVRFQLTTDAALSIYKSMLLPLFIYCSILNANPSRTHQERIDNFENRAQRIVYRSGNPNGNQQLISVKELNKKRVCLQVFKCMIGETCENFQNYFEIMNNKTRNRNCLIRLRVAKLE